MKDFYRNKLNKLLSKAKNEDFILLLWAVNTLQSEYAEASRGYILPATIPEDARTTEMTSVHFIQKWEIETLANELMTVPKNYQPQKGKIRLLRGDHFLSCLQCVNWLRKLENAEFKILKQRQDISVEMGRIAARQFEWQRGFRNIPQFYRNAFVYGQGDCAEYFADNYGISIERFTHIGFILYVALSHAPAMPNAQKWRELGVGKDELERFLRITSAPFKAAAQLARKQRGKTVHVADKPSVLRSTPCLRFGNQGQRIRAPLPELILERVTSGVFYDVVKGGGAIRNDYGKRFEDYCYNYLRDMLPMLHWEREFQYRRRHESFDSPDILGIEGDKLSFVFECKATRMSHEAMFGIDPMKARGYDDMVKAVFQLWRFFSHCRRELVDYNLPEEPVGVVLTLDNWLVLADTLRQDVFKKAEEMAAQKDADITRIDRAPIVFVAVSEMERALSTASESVFKKALFSANTRKFSGWRIDGIVRELGADEIFEYKPYPYADKLGNLLPWWNEYDHARQTET